VSDLSNAISPGAGAVTHADAHNAHNAHGDHGGLVAHHFADRAQQLEAGTLGMWLFLATEVMFIGAIFVGFFAYRLSHYQPLGEHTDYFYAFKTGSENLITWIGAVNTAVLLTSSLTVVLAIRAAQLNKQSQIVLNLVLTIILGSMFFGFKVLEYYKDYQEHLWPAVGAHFEPERGFEIEKFSPLHQAEAREMAIERSRLFFRFYYSLTGLHAAHMLVGIGIFVFLLVQSARGKYTPESHAQLEISGLYWHFVDLVWIFLFPLLYLIR
jgi:cytochrome c oxidase subunit 3